MTILRRARRQTVIAVAVIAVFLFATAGTLAWPGAWLYLAILALSTLLPLWGPLRLDTGLLEERMDRRRPGAKPWDRVFVSLIAWLTAFELVVPGLDRRWHWTAPLPAWATALGLALALTGTAGVVWAMRTNRFFSTVIRIQTDRGHHVIDTGPYALVRHPGYATWSLRTLGVPLVLGSLWAFLPAVVFVSIFAVRTALEDRVLHNELPGYRAYARRVRWRLVPGIW